MPNVQAGASSAKATVLTSRPRLGAMISTRSPGLWVKPWPGTSRSWVGANSVPRNSIMPSGYWWWRPIACSTRSSGSRLISLIELAPSRT